MNKKLLFLLPLFFSLIANGQHIALHSGYSIDIYPDFSESVYDPDANILTVEACKNLTLSMLPETPLNGAYYSLHTENGEFIRNSNNSYQFWNVSPGNYIIKDGSTQVVHLKAIYVDPSQIWELALVDDQNNIIDDFSAENLNSKTIYAGVKSVVTNELVVPCDAFPNWSVNGSYVSSLSAVTLKAEDEICLFLDGTEECSEGCFNWMEGCFTVSSTVTSIVESNKEAVKVFPNPASSQLQISVPEEYINLEMYDNTGVKVYFSEQKILKEVILDIHHLSPGIYLLIVNTGKGIYKQRWVKSGN